jgi:phosphomannomutase
VNLAALHKSSAPEQYSAALQQCPAKIARETRFSSPSGASSLHAALHYDRFSVYDAQQVQEIDFIAMVAQAEKAVSKHLISPLFCAFLP